jgi:putative tricarboxylic transport membrane protein
MRKYEISGALLWLILGIIVCIGSIKLHLTYANNLGPGFMPFVSGLLLGLFGLILLVSSVWKQTGGEIEINDPKVFEVEKLGTVFYALLAILGYVLLLEILGFIIVTFLFTFFLFKITAPKKWAMPLILSGCTVLASYFILCVLLKNVFPRGILGF